MAPRPAPQAMPEPASVAQPPAVASTAAVQRMAGILLSMAAPFLRSGALQDRAQLGCVHRELVALDGELVVHQVILLVHDQRVVDDAVALALGGLAAVLVHGGGGDEAVLAEGEGLRLELLLARFRRPVRQLPCGAGEGAGLAVRAVLRLGVHLLGLLLVGLVADDVADARADGRADERVRAVAADNAASDCAEARAPEHAFLLAARFLRLRAGRGRRD